MRRKRRHERRPPHDRWLVSYADFITLLFAFFVVMYSAAQLDKRRAGQLATAIQTAFLQHGSLPDKPSDVGGLSESGTASNLSVGETDEFKLLKGQIESALAGEIFAGDVAVQEYGEGLVVSLREIGFLIAAQMKSKLVQPGPLSVWQIYFGKRTAKSGSRVTLIMCRSTMRDFRPTGTLSAARATATVRLLIQSYSLRPELL